MYFESFIFRTPFYQTEFHFHYLFISTANLYYFQHRKTFGSGFKLKIFRVTLQHY